MIRTFAVAAPVVIVATLGAVQHPADRSGAGWQPGMVRVDAVVEDASGEPLSGLAKGDFQIFSDGQPRPIEFFSSSDSALTLLVLVDVTASLDPGSSGLPSGPRDLDARTAMVPAVETFPLIGLRPPDRVRVGAIGRRLFLSPRFTGDLQDKSDWSAVFALPPVEWLGPSPIWDAVDQAVSIESTESDQRAIVLVTDGEASGNVRSSADATASAAAGGVSVNIVAEEAVLAKAPARQARWNPPGFRLTDRGIDPTTTLRAMALATGGVYFLDTFGPFNPDLGRDPGKYVSRILDRLHHAYVLGFVPQARDGTTHTLQVRVDRAGATVHVRRSYRASTPGL